MQQLGSYGMSLFTRGDLSNYCFSENSGEENGIGIKEMPTGLVLFSISQEENTWRKIQATFHPYFHDACIH